MWHLDTLLWMVDSLCVSLNLQSPEEPHLNLSLPALTYNMVSSHSGKKKKKINEATFLKTLASKTVLKNNQTFAMVKTMFIPAKGQLEHGFC